MFIQQQKGISEQQKDLAKRKEELAKRKAELAERKKELAKYQNELNELEQAYQRQNNFQLFVVCGPEGSGKTMMIKEFCGWKRRIFFNTPNYTDILKSFSESVLLHYDKVQTEHFNSWDKAFMYIADNEQRRSRIDKRLVLVLHEFPDLVNRNDKFMEMLENAIAQYLSKTKIFMIVSCSDTEFMQKYFIDENAPLHKYVSDCIRLEHVGLDEATAQKIADEAARNAKGITNARMKIQKISADEVILREGETNNEIYKIITGSAVCWLNYGTENEHVLASMADGECFGEYSVLTGKPSIYTVVAFSDMLVMKITKDDLATFVEMNANNAIEIMKSMTRIIDVLAMNIDMMLNN